MSLSLFDKARVFHWPRAPSLCGPLAQTSTLVLVTTSSVGKADEVETDRTYGHGETLDSGGEVLPSCLHPL